MRECVPYLLILVILCVFGPFARLLPSVPSAEGDLYILLDVADREADRRICFLALGFVLGLKLRLVLVSWDGARWRNAGLRPESL